MSQPSKGQKNDLMVEVKSKFDAEFRRFAVNINEISTFEAFQAMLAEVHLLSNETSHKIFFRAHIPEQPCTQSLFTGHYAQSA